MCSSTSARLARIYRAIEELERLGAADCGGQAGGSAVEGGSADADRGEGHDVGGSPTALGRGAGAVGESAADAKEDGVADGGGEADAKGDGRTDAESDNVTDADGDSAPGTDGGNVAAGGRAAGADADVACRLAEIWAMIADADPELAKRLPRYLGPNS